MNEKTKLMTASAAAARLKDILKWKSRLQPTYQTTQAIRYDHDRVSGGGEHGLDFGLDQVIDTSWTDGPQGTTTPEGVDKWLRFWNPWMTYWAGLPHAYRKEPGPLFLQQLQENKIFNTITTWDEDDQKAWHEFTSELTAMWARLRKLTGNQPLRRGLCPICRQGWLQSPPNRHGYTDTATCSNHHCQTTIDHSTQEHAASIRAAMRTDTPENLYLPLEGIRLIWPGIKTGTLRKWVHDGHVRKQGALYNLHDINTRRLPHRATRDIVTLEGVQHAQNARQR